MEKEIKKNSLHQIESSLPEISSLDNIPIKKTNTTRRNPVFYFAPLGFAALLVTAIVLPNVLKGKNPIIPSPSTSQSASYNNSNSGSSTHHNYNNRPTFNFDGYQPTFNEFNEVAYYSYYLNNQTENVNVNNNGLRPAKKLIDKTAELKSGESYTDNYGRLHYPIDLEKDLSFFNFLYFEFDSVDNAFLEERIGNGHIYALVVESDVTDFHEHIIILKNGEHYYSCLTNGGGTAYNGNLPYMTFSAHKTIENFDIVKDVSNKRYLTVHFSGTVEFEMNYETASYIDIEGDEFSIDPESVYYDPEQVVFSFEELREVFGLDPNYEVINGYAGPDALVYDASIPETANFTIDEYEGTFRVNQDELFLNDDKILDLNGATKIYVAEINKDFKRELVFESIVENERMFNIYDIVHSKYLYQKQVSRIGEYDYYLTMMNNRVTVKAYEVGMTDEKYLIDYGYFAYFIKNTIDISWQNLFTLNSLRINRVLEADYMTEVEYENAHYCFKSNTPYIIELKLSKYGGDDVDYPGPEHPILCEPHTFDENMPNQSVEWKYQPSSDGIYHYQIKFSERGYSYYSLRLYRYTCELRAAVDNPDGEPGEDIDQIDGK